MKSLAFGALSLLYFLTWISTPGTCAAATKEAADFSIWRDVPKFRGEAIISYRASGRLDDPYAKEEAESEEDVTVRFELERLNQTVSSEITWQSVRIDVSGHTKSSSNSSNPNNRRTFHSGGSFSQELKESTMTLTIDPETGKWEINTPSQLDTPYLAMETSSAWSSATDRTEKDSREVPYSSIQSYSSSGMAPKEIIPLRAKGEFAHQDPEGEGGLRMTTLTSRSITLWPELQDFEVEVTIDGYETWRPLGSLKNPGMHGNELVVKATLKRAEGGGSGPLPEIDHFRFELLYTSREPGVCMNWPLDAQDTLPDIRLAIDSINRTEVGAEGQTLTVLAPVENTGNRTALARIRSYDFGGRSALRVVCKLASGREILGKLVADGESVAGPITLPKMKQGDWIAEAWRIENNVHSLNAAWDEEATQGSDHNGDGFTLYEEYRGFMENGKRIEGSPLRKDFFVLNHIHADAWPGIRLFEKATGIKVHHKLKPEEMSEKDRLMNGNRSEAPHRVDQHGVVMRTMEGEKMKGMAGGTFFSRYDVAGRPGLTKQIGILPRSGIMKDLKSIWNLPKSTLSVDYDLTVAHELAHSVGMDHHGNTDAEERDAFVFVFADDPRNKTGRPLFWKKGTREVIQILDEKQQADYASRIEAKCRAKREEFKSGFEEEFRAESKARLADRTQSAALEFKDVETLTQVEINDAIPGLKFHIGAPQGEHSGDQKCMTRYTVADAYWKKGGTSTLYIILEDKFEPGTQLCASSRGTGVNGNDHSPQSRHGDAAGNFGNCASQICVNDAIPPRKI